MFFSPVRSLIHSLVYRISGLLPLKFANEHPSCNMNVGAIFRIIVVRPPVNSIHT